MALGGYWFLEVRRCQAEGWNSPAGGWSLRPCTGRRPLRRAGRPRIGTIHGTSGSAQGHWLAEGPIVGDGYADTGVVRTPKTRKSTVRSTVSIDWQGEFHALTPQPPALLRRRRGDLRRPVHPLWFHGLVQKRFSFPRAAGAHVRRAAHARGRRTGRHPRRWSPWVDCGRYAHPGIGQERAPSATAGNLLRVAGFDQKRDENLVHGR